MKKEDKLKHIESVEKTATSLCFDKCFNVNKMKLNDDCVKTCYDKFLFSIKEVMDIVKSEGRQLNSEYVHHAFGEADFRGKERVKDVAFPVGGVAWYLGDLDYHRYKVFESY